MSGNDTLFKTREVPAPAVADPPPRTLFEFTRAWDHTPASDTAARWALLNAIAPPSLRALFGSSLEPALLASFVPVLASASAPAATLERHEAVSRDAVRAFMCTLTRVPRFRTVVQFLSGAERSAARAVWEAVVQSTGNDSAEVEEAARTWGFADASA
ncbi:hypothetical protein BC826DRAFT_1014929 [Russula brevipes]|nr:hypothetical protein BC826DRAFT_1014929 [Russula brevipes]